MKPSIKQFALSALAVAVAQVSSAGTNPAFTPLTQSSAVAPPNHVNELNSPWQTPAGVTQRNLMSMAEVEADVTQSVQRVTVDGLGGEPGVVATMFDMLAFDTSGNYLFIPHESPVGAGVSRYDLKNDRTEVLFVGDQGGDRTDVNGPTWDTDFGAFDPARFTPNGTVILGEEWSGQGRVVEVMDPLGPAPIDPVAGGSSLVEGEDWRVLDSIARVSHEGINFSVQNPDDTIYFIDEDRSGSIYKLVLKNRNDYASGGQTFVLKTDGFSGDVTARWDADANQAPGVSESRFGMATWVPITDMDGGTLPGITNPFGEVPADCVDNPIEDRCQVSARPGRDAADDAGGTPFGRPEDMSIGESYRGNEMLYVTTTSENAVISIEEMGRGKAMVRSFASAANTPKNLGFEPTTGVLNAPDNLAIDSFGNVYIIEDAPNGSSVGGDIWFARDTNEDGVAESIDHFLSIQVNGSEATGMIFNPAHPEKFVVAVQHPSSTDLAEVPEGYGDAVWEFDVSGMVPPVCAKGRFHAFCGEGNSLWVERLKALGRRNTAISP